MLIRPRGPACARLRRVAARHRKACGRACQFIRPDCARLETAPHGRAADATLGNDASFWVMPAVHRARLIALSQGTR